MAFENNYYTEIVFKVKNFAFLLCILERKKKEREREVESKKKKEKERE